jgi:hypothetical protein
MEDVKGNWRKQYNKEHGDMYSSPYIVRIIKSRSD